MGLLVLVSCYIQHIVSALKKNKYNYHFDTTAETNTSDHGIICIQFGSAHARIQKSKC